MGVPIRVFRLRFRYAALAVLLAGLIYGSWVKISGELEWRSIEALSTALAGKVIVIDPGHGGKDPGSKGTSGTQEKDITLEISKKLAAMLGQAGALVLLTRDCDMWLADPDAPHKKRSDLTRRVEIANSNNADAFISIHVNSFVYDRGQRGAQTFSQPGSEEGKLLSRYVQDEMSRILGNTKRKPKEIDYFIRRSKAPAVIVEVGFLSNPAEEKLLLDPAYQSKVAFAIYGGLVKYFAGMVTNGDPQEKNGLEVN
ncbi:MAG: N-acetylmuramoyl-L-alanine amidase [Actinobacteria bacterium]|nr:N-acetylmuramoyl-L-alanine amidase [Actinomycetota bacterium]